VERDAPRAAKKSRKKTGYFIAAGEPLAPPKIRRIPAGNDVADNLLSWERCKPIDE